MLKSVAFSSSSLPFVALTVALLQVGCRSSAGKVKLQDGAANDLTGNASIPTDAQPPDARGVIGQTCNNGSCVPGELPDALLPSPPDVVFPSPPDVLLSHPPDALLFVPDAFTIDLPFGAPTSNDGGASVGIDGGASCSLLGTSNDPANCGACGNVCPAGRVAQTIALGIAVDGTNIYWTSPTGSTVMKVPLAGGKPTTLASGQSSPSAIAVDATNVYWTNSNGGTVMTVPLGGGTPTALALGQANPNAIAVDATNVYWTNKGTLKNNWGDGAVMKAPLAGGPSTPIASNQDTPAAIALDAGNVYWTNWGTTALGTVMKVPLAGGAPTTLATGRGPEGIAVDAKNVYWMDDGLGALMQVPTAGGTATVLAHPESGISYSTSRNYPSNGIAVDSANVYWTDPYVGAVMEAPLVGGNPTAIASGQSNPKAILVNSGSFYFATDTGVMTVGCRNSVCMCPGGQVHCGSSCIDTSSDSANCGACGALCSAPLTCKSGLCSCSQNADCPNQACVGGACTGVCAPVAVRCDASGVETCSTSGQWSLTTACSLGCRPNGSAKCRDCESGDTKCSGITLQSCDDSGIYVNGSPCPSACVAGHCVSGSECNYGDAQCVSGGLQQCSTDGTWASPSACDANATCTAGACVGPQECDRMGTCCYALVSEGAIPTATNCVGLTRSATGSTCLSTLQSWQSEGFCLGL